MKKKVNKRVAIIGAGPSGLGTAKCLLEEGHQVTVFEKSDRIGGLWDYREDRPGGVYETTQFQTSKFISGFSDFPMSEEISVFPMHWEILQYLKDYAGHFKLEELLSLNTEVLHARPEGSRWRIEVKKGEVRSEEIFDAIAICTGQYWEPSMPKLPGQENFRGTVMHSAQFHNNAGLNGKKVVVVGSGVTGMDIAVDASRVSGQVQWSVRTKNWIRPRWFGLIPYESGVAQGVHFSRDDLLEHWKEWIPEHYENFVNSGLVPDKAPFAEGIGANDEILGLIDEDKIRVRPQIKALTPNGCIFDDGEEVDADVIMLATGYESFRFPFLDQSVLDKLKIHDEGVDLYYHVFHPDIQNCAFIFCVAGNAPAMPTLELQARWFSRVLSGLCQLPSAEDMWSEIGREVQNRRAKLNKTRYRSNFIDGAYLVKLAEQIGVLPNKVSDFESYLDLISPPSFPYIYRVYGPHSWPDARKVIELTKQKYLLKFKHHDQLKKQTLVDSSKKELLMMYKNSQISKEELVEALQEKELERSHESQPASLIEIRQEANPMSLGQEYEHKVSAKPHHDTISVIGVYEGISKDNVSREKTTKSGVNPVEQEFSSSHGGTMDQIAHSALDAAWQALENAGYQKASLTGRITGIFIQIPLIPSVNISVDPASLVSQSLGLRGPVETTICSETNGLSVIHRAISAIKAGECETAIVIQLTYQNDDVDSVLSIGAVILKARTTASSDGDIIRGIINASGIVPEYPDSDIRNNAMQGARTWMKFVGYRARPDEAFWLTSEIAEEPHLSYRDCDDIQNFASASNPSEQKCHVTTSSGIFALFEAMQTLAQQSIKDNASRCVSQRLVLSSKAYHGANVNLIIEGVQAENIPPTTENNNGISEIITISAANEEALYDYVRVVKDYLDNIACDNGVALQDIAYTLQVGRESLPQRLVFLANSVEHITTRLKEFLASNEPPVGMYLANADKRERSETGLEVLMEDKKFSSSLVRTLSDTGNFEQLARLWASGVSIDWMPLWEGRSNKRVVLPGRKFKDSSGVVDQRKVG